MANSVPKDFLLGPGPEVEVQRVDFIKAGLPEYKNCYAVVLDNVLSEDECQQLLAAAESTSNGLWERALVNTGGNSQKLIVDVRNCGRIIWDDFGMVERIWKRIKPHVPEIEILQGRANVMGNGPVKRNETYKMSRLNERMRFLKYTGGEYFHEHCDGMYVTPDGSERSYYTLHLYMNERNRENNLVGGATTFHSYNMGKDYNVYPKIGRILLFQQRDLLHSGQAVDGGVKYTMRTDLMYSLEKKSKRV